jgi:transposase
VSYNFHPINRDPFLLPPDMSEWLPKGHLAYFVIEVVDVLDLSAFMAKFREDGAGATAYHPKVLLGVLLYAYCHGLRSSRQIERHCQEDVAYRVIAANQQPDHTTISRFVTRNMQALSDLFVQALKLCASAGLIKLGTVALDGTKIKANAALDSNRTHSSLKKEIDQILAEACEEDRREDGF